MRAREKLDAARRTLLAEAELRGWRLAEQQLQVWADDRPVLEREAKHKLRRFALPAGTRAVRIGCQASAPAEIDLGSADRRRLGARIGAVFLDGAFVPLDSPVLADGFHALERNGGELWRWTTGDAVLQLPAGNADQEVTLELLVRDVMRHWRATTLTAFAQPPEQLAKAPGDRVRAEGGEAAGGRALTIARQRC